MSGRASSGRKRNEPETEPEVVMVSEGPEARLRKLEFLQLKYFDGSKLAVCLLVRTTMVRSAWFKCKYVSLRFHSFQQFLVAGGRANVARQHWEP